MPGTRLLGQGGQSVMWKLRPAGVGTSQVTKVRTSRPASKKQAEDGTEFDMFEELKESKEANIP